MSKLIIHNRVSELSDVEALKIVMEVVKRGRISKGGESYCLMTLFDSEFDGYDVAVSASVNKESDRFTITKYPRSNK